MVKEKLLRQFVSTVCLCFSFDFLEKRPAVQPERKGVKAVVLGPESSDTEIKDAFEGKYKSVCLQSRYAVKWVGSVG